MPSLGRHELGSANSYLGLVDNDQRAPQIGIGGMTEEPFESILGLFHSCRPNSETNHPEMLQGKGPEVRKILIKGDNDS